MGFQTKTKRKKTGCGKHSTRPGQSTRTLEPKHNILELQRMIGNKSVSGLLQAEWQAQEAERPDKPFSTTDADPARGSFLTPAVRQVISGGGRPLDPEFRREAEARLGQDFSAVRVHTGPDAARSTDDIGAAAYTLGEHIAFAGGGFRPEDPAGRRVLAHELAHVVQQRRGGLRPPSPARNGHLEQAA
ncbi:DUF4157 domain-containing protein, partial [Desulfococcus sp.]|uniref:eCIS core domain-containing protein n=1 Tax=Desulfococcus sp. TaxID=2025834 RepID=UPI0035944B11